MSAPPAVEPFSMIPRWLLQAVSPRAYMLYGYYAGRDFDQDGTVYITVKQTMEELGWEERSIKRYRAELRSAEAISSRQGSIATKLNFRREVPSMTPRSATGDTQEKTVDKTGTEEETVKKRRRRRRKASSSEAVGVTDRGTSATSGTSPGKAVPESALDVTLIPDDDEPEDDES